jgi:hypothetical protein
MKLFQPQDPDDMHSSPLIHRTSQFATSIASIIFMPLPLDTESRRQKFRTEWDHVCARGRVGRYTGTEIFFIHSSARKRELTIDTVKCTNEGRVALRHQDADVDPIRFQIQMVLIGQDLKSLQPQRLFLLPSTRTKHIFAESRILHISILIPVPKY